MSTSVLFDVQGPRAKRITMILNVVAVLVVGAVWLFWRPLLFASADPVMAQAAGVPVRAFALLFAVLVGQTDVPDTPTIWPVSSENAVEELPG